ncbi:hypothetical protein Cni_G00095 [Canna indica]|uniref:Reverse transcriptase zinc-binding domain-containing protein n=1 Tax=Canna indica TaxID=4628 RepID=A0AAQ3PYY1_9LILI|nr:hypothetical protein Cni_G00095 [Canna indica]
MEGNFSTKSLYLLLTFRGVTDLFHCFLWGCKPLPKVSIFGWIRLRERLLTRDRLVRWGITSDTSCLLCDGLETHEHLFISCPYSCAGWRVFLSLVNYSFFSLFEAPWNSQLNVSHKVAVDHSRLILIRSWFIWFE